VGLPVLPTRRGGTLERGNTFPCGGLEGSCLERLPLSLSPYGAWSRRFRHGHFSGLDKPLAHVVDVRVCPPSQRASSLMPKQLQVIYPVTLYRLRKTPHVFFRPTSLRLHDFCVVPCTEKTKTQMFFAFKRKNELTPLSQHHRRNCNISKQQGWGN